MFDLELVRMVPGLRVDELLPVFDVGQRLGARVLNVIGSDPEPQRLVDTPPYYAVRLYPGDIGAATGFATDADARVLDRSGTAIPGLYAAGNDMQSIMGGVYPAPGITLGPGLVFAYIATRHAVARGSA